MERTFFFSLCMDCNYTLPVLYWRVTNAELLDGSGLETTVEAVLKFKRVFFRC